MRTALMCGAALIALAPAALCAQTTAGGSPLDSDIPADAAPAQPVPTGDPVLDRLNALEAKVDALQAENAALKQEVDSAHTRIGSVEEKEAKAVKFSWGPQLSDASGNFTFKPRGMLEIDGAHYSTRAGGYDFNDGTLIRRGRFGFDGTAFKHFDYRIEAEFIGNTVNLLDAYVGYTGFKGLTLIIGQQKAPYGLEANSSDAFNTFMERGMANVAFGAVGAERRVGITAAYSHGPLIATVGFFGAGEAVGRNATTPGEVRGVNGRVTVEPVNADGKVIHLGASAYHVSHFAANSLAIGDRPNSRVDGGYLEQISIPGTRANGVDTGARSATLYAFEGAGVLGPVSVQGEYQHLQVDRFGVAPTLAFHGFYGFGSLFLTGEHRSFRNGVVDRLTPIRPFDPAAGQWGAVELALRYDRLDLTDRALSPLDHVGESLTGAVNWYLTGNVKLMFNYVRFKGSNSPLVAAPVALYGTTSKGDIVQTRLHLDF